MTSPVRITIAGHPNPAPTIPAAANCDAPANTITEKAIASIGENPLARAVSPKTTPKPAADATMPSMSNSSRRRAARSVGASGSGPGARVIDVVGRGGS